ncbi:MAG TPA: hypothetical protein VGS60_06875 [Actinomycetes bacterium]|nr:hypothetical protein [Actinomycetes bacterium]
MSGTHGRLSVPKIRAWLSGWTGLESATEHMLTCSARRTLDT